MSIESLGALMCTHAIQIGLLGSVVFAVWKLFAQDRPHLAHALWALLVLKCLTPPIVASPVSPFSWIGVQTQPATPIPPSVAQTPAPDQPKLAAVQIFYSDVAASTNAPHVTPEPMNPTWPKARYVLLAVCAAWLAGTLAISLTLFRRVTLYVRTVRRKTVTTPSWVGRLTSELTTELDVRRRVQICVVDAPIGPAVVGLLRPMLLLPKCVIDNNTKLALRPLIAHELVHIRRGDLWWTAAQTLCSVLWWFHPCVWITGRMLTRETERSCDEETIASLKCKPSDYARSLLNVLEQKAELIAAPIVPGVRPMDLTVTRMERIMRLGHGSHARNPRWTWALLCIGATLVLPGAGWLTAQETTSQPPGKRLPSPKVLIEHPPATAAPKEWPTSDKEGENIVVLEVKILEVPTKLLTQWTVPPSATGSIITGGTITSDTGVPGKLRIETPDGITLEAATILLSSAQGTFGLSPKNLTFPMILSDEKLATVQEWIANKGETGVSVVNSPSLATRSGVQASIQIGQERPFVESMPDPSERKPTVRVVETGLHANFTATLKCEEDSPYVELRCNLRDVDIASVKESEETTPDGTVVKLQRPTTRTNGTEFTLNTPLGSTIAATLETGETTTLFIITPNKLQPPIEGEPVYSSPAGAKEEKATADARRAATEFIAASPELTSSLQPEQAIKAMQQSMNSALKSIENATAEVKELTNSIKVTLASHPKAPRPSEAPIRERPISYKRVSIAGPTTTKGRSAKMEPSDSEVLLAFDKLHAGMGGPDTDNGRPVKFVKEKTADFIDPVRFIPLLGNCQLHHRHYKCSIHFQKNGKEQVEVVYVDYNNFEMTGNPEMPATQHQKIDGTTTE